jgi:hypothetical protein
MFRPLHGHRQGVFQENNTTITDSAKDLHFFGRKKFTQIKFK